jgi:hypothetical protein
MPTRKFFYIKNLTTGKFHRGATYGGNWGSLPQFFSRRHDAEYRKRDLEQRSHYGRIPDAEVIVILETKITWI